MKSVARIIYAVLVTGFLLGFEAIMFYGGYTEMYGMFEDSPHKHLYNGLTYAAILPIGCLLATFIYIIVEAADFDNEKHKPK